MKIDRIRAATAGMARALALRVASRPADPVEERMRASLRELEEALDVLRRELVHGRAAGGGGGGARWEPCPVARRRNCTPSAARGAAPERVGADR